MPTLLLTVLSTILGVVVFMLILFYVIRGAVTQAILSTRPSRSVNQPVRVEREPLYDRRLAKEKEKKRLELDDHA